MRSRFNASGFSLVELSVAVGIMSISMLAMMTMSSNQQQSNQFLEFQLNRMQLQNTLIGQVFSNMNSCGCLFQNADPFPSSGISELGGTLPTSIKRFTSPPPGCAPVGNTLIDSVGVGGMKATYIGIKNILPTGPNSFIGDFLVVLQTTKRVIGPNELPLQIPVNIQTTPSGSDNRLQSCTTGAANIGLGNCRLVLVTWDSDNCGGNTMTRYSDWFRDVAPGTIGWTRLTSAGVLGGYSGRNRNPGDIACMRVGLQCQ